MLLVMSKITQDCWKDNPSARLTALNIKKKLAKLKEADPTMSQFDEAAEDIDVRRLREKLQRESEECIRVAHAFNRNEPNNLHNNKHDSDPIGHHAGPVIIA